MPRGDRTGPAGLGPMTGRAAGYCAGYSVPGYMNPVWGRGFFGRGRGGGFGRGRGYRNMYWATGLPGWARFGGYWPAETGVYPYGAAAPTPQQEAEALKNQVKYMQETMNGLNERIRELESTKTETEEYRP
jgi:hypothetical protein